MWCVHACNYNVFHTDRVQEGIRELDMLKDKRDINLCATMALMFAHKKSHNVGQSVCVCVCERERWWEKANIIYVVCLIAYISHLKT